MQEVYHRQKLVSSSQSQLNWDYKYRSSYERSNVLINLENSNNNRCDREKDSGIRAWSGAYNMTKCLLGQNGLHINTVLLYHSFHIRVDGSKVSLYWVSSTNSTIWSFMSLVRCKVLPKPGICTMNMLKTILNVPICLTITNSTWFT